MKERLLVKNATSSYSPLMPDRANGGILAMRYAVSRVIMAALAAGVLVFTAGCMSTVPDGMPYHIQESGIQELKTDYDDCYTSRGAPQAIGKVEEKLRFTLTSEQDVDTAYARLKRAFGFQAPAERAPPAGTPRESLQRGSAYHHRITPGATYSMRQRREIDGYTGVIQIDIEREDNGSRLAVRYLAGGEGGFPPGEGFRRFVETKVREALR